MTAPALPPAIDQIKRAHASARPNVVENPAWTNCHRDCGALLKEIERLTEALHEAFGTIGRR